MRRKKIYTKITFASAWPLDSHQTWGWERRLEERRRREVVASARSRRNHSSGLALTESASLADPSLTPRNPGWFTWYGFQNWNHLLWKLEKPCGWKDQASMWSKSANLYGRAFTNDYNANEEMKHKSILWQFMEVRNNDKKKTLSWRRASLQPPWPW